MPNQRKNGKKQVGVWLTTRELERVENAAAEYKVNRSDLLKLAIEFLLSDSKNTKGKSNEKQ